MPRLFRQQSSVPAPTNDPAQQIGPTRGSLPNNGLDASRRSTHVEVVRRGQPMDTAPLNETRGDRGLSTARMPVMARSGNDSAAFDNEDDDLDERMDDPEGGLAADVGTQVSWGPMLIAALAIGGAVMLMRNR